jgi:glycosidase
MEFHISRKTRDKYVFDQSIFSLNGNAVLGNLSAARDIAKKINQHLPADQHARASHIYAMGLLDEVFHLVIRHYRKTVSPGLFSNALAWLEKSLPPKTMDRTLLEFCNLFPPLAVYDKEISAEDYLSRTTGNTSNRENALEEMLLLWVENQNPATRKYIEFFDDSELKKQSAYQEVIQTLTEFIQSQPVMKPENLSLIDMILKPIRACPDSLEAQLRYILEHWKEILGAWQTRLLRTLDYIHEETQIRGGGPGPVVGPAIRRSPGEMEIGENYSADRSWMNDLVLIAKNSYVWLDQLSKKYQRPIIHLNQIPDEELDALRDAGITGLWLIGLWERSRASERIKKICGNPEAAASAYSIYDYRIADDLGGEPALQGLKDRAWQRGIRMASDMVPNHYGIDSPWLVNHPEWFVQVPSSPYSAYTFNGPDLSADSRAGIFVEDHYYDRTDAAVVFKYHDNTNGQDRFIYHGNDGTNMPWNDTAQLNYLDPHVREHIIQTILHVARLFPIIRFDAAMTLVKRHIQRLWYPEPGSGGAIPSRSENGLTTEEFNQQMPEEFWRQVVEGIRQEQPDTLLLAEAFWMMEGFFVRSLGMHRVYNSAFMNMLRDEKNSEYRQIIKASLETEPQILKRFVNFMNNPDERTAVEQFGKGDKYFGIFTLMSTFPGLPMVGHGQIEGFLEKYGMEYRRSYLNESPDREMVERHQREIFPLLRSRRFFSGVSAFRLFDFFKPEGYVDENVYAYANYAEDIHSLVLFNNQYQQTRGWVRMSSATRNPELNTTWQAPLAECLNLHAGNDTFCILKDARSGMETLHASQDIFNRGLYFELNGYENRVFFPIREVMNDEAHPYRLIWSMLNGRPVPSIDDLIHEYSPKSTRELYLSTLDAGSQVDWAAVLAGKSDASDFSPFTSSFNKLCRQVYHSEDISAVNAAGRMDTLINRLVCLDGLSVQYPLPSAQLVTDAVAILSEISYDAPVLRLLMPAWLIQLSLAQPTVSAQEDASLTEMDRNDLLQSMCARLSLSNADFQRIQFYLKASEQLSAHTLQVSPDQLSHLIEEYLSSFTPPEKGSKHRAAVHRDSLLLFDWLFLSSTVEIVSEPDSSASAIIEHILRFWYARSAIGRKPKET